VHWLRLAEAVGIVFALVALFTWAAVAEVVEQVVIGIMFLGFLVCLVMVFYSLLGG
jgi:hypothetical protein